MGGEVQEHGAGVQMRPGWSCGVVWKKKGTLKREKERSEERYKEEDSTDKFFCKLLPGKTYAQKRGCHYVKVPEQVPNRHCHRKEFFSSGDHT